MTCLAVIFEIQRPNVPKIVLHIFQEIFRLWRIDKAPLSITASSHSDIETYFDYLLL